MPHTRLSDVHALPHLILVTTLRFSINGIFLLKTRKDPKAQRSRPGCPKLTAA